MTSFPRKAAVLALTCWAAAAAGTAGLAAEPPSLRKGPLPMETSCVVCHRELDGAALEPVTRAADDVHFQKGLACHDCHGGDPEAGMDGDPSAAHDEARGWKGKPSRLQVPELCGRCHADPAFMKRFDPQERTDQLAEYRTSGHGRRNAAGDAQAAVCVDCHGVHGVRPVTDPRSGVHPSRVAQTCARCHSDASLMAPYGLPTRQHEQYQASVHARALYEGGDTSAPTCNDCHGSHGAVPPGVSSVANVCGSCHTREATLFREIEARKGMDLEACIQCLICHSNHEVKPPTPEMLGVGEGSTCTGCHAEGDAGWAGAATMAEGLGRLRRRLAEASEQLDAAEHAGMEVGPDRFALQTASDQLVEARVLVHSFDIERFSKAAAEGIAAADEGVAAAGRAFRELRSRRNGLALSLVVIAAVMVSLILTIRRIERR
ncbi:MAG TPA: hypothetical protein VJV23_01060 [Candidatus Polarisedimenticolia bacterium]|nr:hypothetical protein [Candidatus Polarisedimenticolia bacterium]